MTEPDNQLEFEASAESDDFAANEPDVSEPTPVSDVEDVQDVSESPSEPEVQDAASDVVEKPYNNEPEFNVNSAPVSAVPTPGALSDPKPEQTDNSERPEDGEQDVFQDPDTAA